MHIKLSFNQKEKLSHQQPRASGQQIFPDYHKESTSYRKNHSSSAAIFNQKNSPGQSTWSKIEGLLGEFDSLIGLDHIKELLKEVAAFIEIQKYRSMIGLVAEPMTLHMLFKGAPGTGKTTVARLIGKLYRELGVLSKGHLIEVDRADLVGEYIGHTAQKTKEQLKKAVGGILFIDEAYSLARGGEKDFGVEATDVLVKVMEDERSDLIIILAGYTQEMNYFIASNPGLTSRFPIQLEFPNYSVSELMAIADLMLKARQYHLTEDAAKELERILRKGMLQGYLATGNGRFVRNLLEKAIRRQAVRLIRQHKILKEELMTIHKSDLAPEMEAAVKQIESRIN